MTALLRPLYDWTLRLAETPYALWALAAISFVESSVFPIPPDLLLIPMILARPDRAWLIAGVCTLASVAGGMAGWGLGYFLLEEVGRPVLELYGKADLIEPAKAQFNEWGVWAVVFAGITPFPYKVITIAAGMAEMNIWAFALASVFARGIRFFLIAALLWKYGERMRVFIEERLGLLATLALVLLFGGFLAIRFFV